MKPSRYTDSQIIAILKQAEAGSPIPELCREHGMSTATFYKWRAKFGGMDASLMARMKELEEENKRLKKMYAEERLKAEIVAEALAKKWQRHLSAARWRAGWLTKGAQRSVWLVWPLASARRVFATRPSSMPRTKSLQTGWSV